MAKRQPLEFFDGDTLAADIGDSLAALFFFPGDTILGTLVDLMPGLAGAVGISDFIRGDTLSAIISLASWFAIFLVSKLVLDKCFAPSD